MLKYDSNGNLLKHLKIFISCALEMIMDYGK